MDVGRARRILIAFVAAIATIAGVVVPVSSAQAGETVQLVESFDDPLTSWVQAKGSASVSATTDATEGTSALDLDYDLSAGTAEAGRTTTPAGWEPEAYSALKLDYKGDGTYNTLYIRIRDATGEVLYYRVGNLNSAAWTTASINLRVAPAATTGGNANGVLDGSSFLYRLVVVRNGTQPAVGSVLVDNLRTVGDGWKAPTATPAYFSAAAGQTATIVVSAASPGDYSIKLSDSSGRSRLLSGTAGTAGDQEIIWNGADDNGVLLQGNVSAVLSEDATPDGSLSNPATVGVPLLVTVAEVDTPAEGETVSLAESFDAGAGAWSPAKGTITAQTSSDLTEGAAGLGLSYDLNAGSAEIGWAATAPTWSPTAYSSIKLDYKGDGTFNTLYLRLRDVTGEVFYYRVGNLNAATWSTATVNLSSPAANSDGNANNVLDAPLSLYRLVVVRNGTQPATGNLVVDNLRTVGNGWGAASATPDYFSTGSDQAATITIPAGSAGDYSLSLRDAAGAMRKFTESIQAPGPQTIAWDGLSDAGSPLQGNISAAISYDATPDGTLIPLATIGTPLLTTVAEIDAPEGTTTVTESFDDGPASWLKMMGVATINASADHTEGASGLGIGYDLSAGSVEIGRTVTPAPWAPTAYSQIKLDFKGDGSFNTLYLRLRDATGEVFYYRLANINTTTWTTATVDLRAAPASSSGGNANGVLDAPLSLYRLAVVRNGTQPATGNLVVDNLRAIGDGWQSPSLSPAYFSAASGQTATISVPVVTSGDYRVVIKDPSGSSRVFNGIATAAGAATFAWDGKTSTGTYFQGNVSATLSYDTTPDGVLTNATTIGTPYLGGVTARPKDSATAASVGVNSSMTTYESIGDADNEAKLMEQAYVHYSREEFEWNRIEPRQDYFDWAKFDQTVAVAKARNVDIIAKLVYTADWASSAPAGTASADIRYFPPADMTDWIDYVTKTVTRYKDSVNVWEVWNEPNLDKYWKPAPNAAAYAEMLTATYAAIKSIQPGSTVLVGGLASGFPESYMNSLLANGAGNAFDGIAMHMYVAGAPEPSIIDSWMSAAETYLARKLPGRSLWITEIGWTTCESCTTKVTEDQQAQFLSRFMIDAVGHGIVGITWFNLRELGTSTSSIDNYGLVERGGRLKPAYTALARFAAGIVQSVPAGTVNPSTTGTSTLLDDMATTSGYSARSLGTGGSTSLQVSSGRAGGSGAIAVKYNYGASTATGSQIVLSKPVSGSPTALSLWVYGDNSNNPMYMKFTDSSGEAFEAKIGNVGTPKWTRLVYYFDGANPNFTHSGGNNDGVINYPITVTQLHVYKSTSGVTSGQFIMDDMTAHYGSPMRGLVFFGRGYDTQVIYALTPRDSKLSVPNATAYIYDRGTITGLSVSNQQASVTLTPTPKFVISAPAAAPVNGPAQSPVTLSLVTGDRSTLTIQVYTKTGALVRTLSTAQPYQSGPRTVVWDGRMANGDWAPVGAYLFRIQTTGTDGRSSVVTRNFTLN
jgi:flagellar hook assembly protein FlgD